jgi:DNA-binding response OmpR family regulator
MAGPGPRGGAILIVEDDPDIRLLASAVLSGAGYTVHEAASGEAAIDFVRSEQPLLVLLDIRLPGVSGYEVCRALRDRFRAAVPIIFMSAERKEVFDRAVGRMLGGDDFVMKPFTNDELLLRVRGLVRRRVPARQSLDVGLTARESEVLRLLASGLTQADIATHLLISGKTVGTHIEHILMKLGVPSRAQAVAVAYRDNLVETNPPTLYGGADPAPRSTNGSPAAPAGPSRMATWGRFAR